MKLVHTVLRVALPVFLLGSLLWSATGQQSPSPGVPRPALEPSSWRNVTITGTGFVPGIIFHPGRPNLIYARTDIGGAYRWDAAAQRWIPLQDWVGSDDANLLGVESVAVDPSDANRVYLAAGTYTQSWAGNGAILRSSDQGRTFQRTNMPFKMGGNEDGRSIGERLAVDPNHNSTLYFGSRHDGLWKSTDFAVTWNKVDSFPVQGRTNGIGIGFVVFDPRGAKAGTETATITVGVAAPGANLYRSTDGGATWHGVEGQPSGLLPHHGVLAADGTLYLSYGDRPGPNGMTNGAVWKLNTRDGRWTDITPVRPGRAGADSFGYAGLAVDAAHPGTVMVATMDRWSPGDDIFRSTDGGATWTGVKAYALRDSSASPFLNWGGPGAAFGHWIGAVAIDPFNSNHVLYGTGATIWGSSDATALDAGRPTHWTVHAGGIEETAVIDLISPPAGAHLISGLGDIGGFRHDDLTVSPRGGLWTNPTMNNVTGLDFAELQPALVARVGTAGKGEKRGAYSTDGGTSWRPFGSEPEGSRNADQRSRSIAVACDGGTLVWVAPDGFAYYSRDLGATWGRSTGLSAKPTVISDRANPHQFYAFDGARRQLFLSTDGGASFAVQAAALPGGRAGCGPCPATRATSGWRQATPACGTRLIPAPPSASYRMWPPRKQWASARQHPVTTIWLCTSRAGWAMGMAFIAPMTPAPTGCASMTISIATVGLVRPSSAIRACTVESTWAPTAAAFSMPIQRRQRGAAAGPRAEVRHQ